MVSHKSIVIKVASDRPSSKMSSWNRQSMLTVQQPILIITGQDQLNTQNKSQKQVISAEYIVSDSKYSQHPSKEVRQG